LGRANGDAGVLSESRYWNVEESERTGQFGGGQPGHQSSKAMLTIAPAGAPKMTDRSTAVVICLTRVAILWGPGVANRRVAVASQCTTLLYSAGSSGVRFGCGGAEDDDVDGLGVSVMVAAMATSS
jgi:hypothetical protein